MRTDLLQSGWLITNAGQNVYICSINRFDIVISGTVVMLATELIATVEAWFVEYSLESTCI